MAAKEKPNNQIKLLSASKVAVKGEEANGNDAVAGPKVSTLAAEKQADGVAYEWKGLQARSEQAQSGMDNVSDSIF